MTGWTVAWWHWAAVAVIVLVLASFVGLALFFLLARSVRKRAVTRAVAKTRAQLRIEYGLHEAVFEGCNTGEIRRPPSGRRSPDEQLVTRAPSPGLRRSAFYD